MTTPNDISASFNQNFLDTLEYHLSKALANSNNNKLKYIWCDGILMPEDTSQLIKRNIDQTHLIHTKVWIGWQGTTRQELFDMEILLGEFSLKNILNNKDMQSCLPEADSTDWIDINEGAKQIQLKLK